MYENSKVFKNWNENAGVTLEEFKEGVEWVRSDPCDGSTGGQVGQLTRELGCDPKRGLVKLKREYYNLGGVYFYEIESGKLWNKSYPSISMRDKI